MFLREGQNLDQFIYFPFLVIPDLFLHDDNQWVEQTNKKEGPKKSIQVMFWNKIKDVWPFDIDVFCSFYWFCKQTLNLTTKKIKFLVTMH